AKRKSNLCLKKQANSWQSWLRRANRQLAVGSRQFDENCRSNPVLFAGKRRRETLPPRKDRLHPKLHVEGQTCAGYSRPEDNGSGKWPLACLHDSRAISFSHSAISGTGQFARARANPPKRATGHH